MTTKAKVTHAQIGGGLGQQIPGMYSPEPQPDRTELEGSLTRRLKPYKKALAIPSNSPANIKIRQPPPAIDSALGWVANTDKSTLNLRPPVNNAYPPEYNAVFAHELQHTYNPTKYVGEDLREDTADPDDLMYYKMNTTDKQDLSQKIRQQAKKNLQRQQGENEAQVEAELTDQHPIFSRLFRGRPAIKPIDIGQTYDTQAQGVPEDKKYYWWQNSIP